MTTEQIKVRVGVPDDLDQVMGLARIMHDEIGISPFGSEQVLSNIYSALNMDQGIMGVIGDPGERIEGAILLKIGKLWYSDDDALEEKGLFIHPDFRSAKGARAKHLCEFAKQTSNKLGMPLLIGIQNDVRTKGKMRLYERQFGEPIGAQWCYRPEVVT